MRYTVSDEDWGDYKVEMTIWVEVYACSKEDAKKSVKSYSSWEDWDVMDVLSVKKED
jgi:hypothetical protein